MLATVCKIHLEVESKGPAGAGRNVPNFADQLAARKIDQEQATKIIRSD